MRHLVVAVLSSIYWTTADERDGAVNGFTLTRGRFQQQVQIEYATGQSPRCDVVQCT